MLKHLSPAETPPLSVIKWIILPPIKQYDNISIIFTHFLAFLIFKSQQGGEETEYIKRRQKELKTLSYLCIYLSIYPSLHLFIYLSNCLLVNYNTDFRFINVSIYLSIYGLPIYLSIYLSICMCMCVYLCLWQVEVLGELLPLLADDVLVLLEGLLQLQQLGRRERSPDPLRLAER